MFEWSAPQRPADSGDTDGTEVSIAHDGTVRVVWAGPLYGPRVWLATAAPGSSTVGAPRRIASFDGSDGFVHAVLSDAGRATFVYERDHKPYVRARARVQQRDGSLGPAVTLSTPGHTARVPTAASNPAGDVLASWRRWNGQAWEVQLARKPRWRDGFLRAETVPSSANAGRDLPVGAVDSFGACVLAWVADGSVFAARGTVEDGLGAPVKVGAYPTGADVAVAVSGSRAVVVWEADRYGHADDQATYFAAIDDGSGFGAAQRLAGPFGAILDGDGPVATVTSDGTALAAYARAGRVSVYTAPRSAAFAPDPQTISPAPGPPENPALGAGPDGGAIVAWDAERPGRPSDTQLKTVVGVALRSPGAAAFGPPQDLSEPVLEGLFPTVALGPGGRAAVGWLQSPEGSGDGNPEVSIRQTGPPPGQAR